MSTKPKTPVTTVTTAAAPGGNTPTVQKGPCDDGSTPMVQASAANQKRSFTLGRKEENPKLKGGYIINRISG